MGATMKILTFDEEPIIALCTPQGSGAIALLRLTGKGSVGLVDKMSALSQGKLLSKMVSHTIHHGHIVDSSKKIIDEVLFFLMRAPRTFTGQDTVEISCHNNPFIVDRIIERAVACGARLAKAGEFSKRAFLSGKIDLVQAESINELISAQTSLALKKSMLQLKGSLSSVVAELENEILSLLGVVEASFEFLDEEQRDLDFDSLIKTRINSLLDEISNLKGYYCRQQQVKEGVRVALLGAVNVGKSTLFNAILKKERSIVTNVSGTTRDTVEAGVHRKGNFWTLIDTAGLRATDDLIEKKGVDRSWNEANVADVVVLVISALSDISKDQRDLYTELSKKYKNKLLLVINKIDLLDREKYDQIQDDLKILFGEAVEPILVSALKQNGINLLEKKIEEKTQKIFEKLESPFLLNKRHFAVLGEIKKKLLFLKKNFVHSKNVEHEIVAHYLRDILRIVSDLTGKNINEKMLDDVFKNFCVGK